MRQIRTLTVLLGLLIPLVQSVARPASADEPAKPWKPQFERCQKLSNDGNYPAALEACERAYELNPDPGILAYIAQIQTVLLRPVQAREALERYLQSGSLPDADRKTAEAQIRFLDTVITTLLVSTPVRGAEIRVDDQVVDPTTVARGVRLMAGAHRVTVQSSGSTFTRFVFLRAGDRTQLELPGSGSLALSCSTPHVRFFIDDKEVDAIQAARGVSQVAGPHRVTFSAGGAPWPEQQVVVSPDERLSVVCARPTVVPSDRPGMNQRGYWVAGAGLALGVAALTTAIYNSYEYDRWQAANDSLRHSLQQEELSLAEGAYRARENNQLMESIQTRRKVALGLGIAGGLVTAGGVALLFADSAASERNRASSWLRKIATGVTISGAVNSGEVAWRGAW